MEKPVGRLVQGSEESNGRVIGMAGQRFREIQGIISRVKSQ